MKKKSNIKINYIAVVIGASGVGKTTTIMKHIGEMRTFQKKHCIHKKIKVITTDTVTVGAIERLSKWAEILKFDFEKAETSNQLQKAIGKSKNYDIIFVDTAPCNPNNEEDILKLSELLGDHSIAAHLLIPAATSECDTKNMSEKFKSVWFKDVIITKCDETKNFCTIRNIIAVLGEEVNFFTNSVNVADGIHRLNDYSMFVNAHIVK